MKSIFKIICITATVWAMNFVAVATQGQPPPFVLLNDPTPEASTWIHTGHGYVNQVVHPDILYFPSGWGNVDGVSYKYWLGITGYQNDDEVYEQPCILVSNSISNDSWKEPADNAYNTNPIPHNYYTNSQSGHFSDIDIVYNDDSDEIWAYFRNNNHIEGWERIELYKTANGVTWDLVSENILVAPDDAYLMSPSVVKEGHNWWMWLIDASTYNPNHLLLYHSTDGINFTFEHDCGYNFRTSSERGPWHIDVEKYDGVFWGFLVERGNQQVLCLIKSPDGKSWSGYESPILAKDIGSWDNGGIYRTSFVIENGFLDAIYTAFGFGGSMYWYAGHTSHAAVGGKGYSSNVIIPGPLPSELPTELVYTPVTPCRAVDTRIASRWGNSPIYSNQTRDIKLWGNLSDQGGAASGCVASDAAAVVVNIAAVPFSGCGGVLTAWAYGTPKPDTSVLNYSACINQDARANGVIVPMTPNTSDAISVWNNWGTTHLVIDVMGYFAPAP